MNILKINSSANQMHSISRNQVDSIVSALVKANPKAKVTHRDVANDNLPYLDEGFVEAMFQKGELNDIQKEKLSTSDALIEELHSSDVLVLGAPMYNFTIPASLKAYFDLIARPGKTFTFTSNGAMTGLVNLKKAIVVITSGGTPIGSPMDFSKGYITSFLKFIGVTNVHFLELDQAGFKYHEKMQEAAKKMDQIIAL